MSQQSDQRTGATGEVSSTKDVLAAQHRKLVDRRQLLISELREINQVLQPLEAALKVLGVEKDGEEESDVPWSELGITEAAERLLRAHPEGMKSRQLADRIASLKVATTATNVYATVYSVLSDKPHLFTFGRDKRWRLPEYSYGVEVQKRAKPNWKARRKQ
jgi:hypothetical protein